MGIKEVGIVGLTFKALTDDMRESPNLVLLQRLQQASIQVSFYDPLVHSGSHLGTEESLRQLIKETQQDDLKEFVSTNKVIVLSHDDEAAHQTLELLTDQHVIIDLDCPKEEYDHEINRQGLSWH